jgi:2-oxopent-4-enoate/cis-2-oxohex-4-enoate hydratase
MQPELIESLANELYAALRNRSTLLPISSRYPNINVDDAYHISRCLLQHRLADGEKLVGKKIGVTSKAVQLMLDVHQPDFGFLTNVMQIADGSTVSLSRSALIQPRAEGEIAFLLRADLRGPNVTREDVLDATECVMPCFEIVDSRIRDWKIRIQDTVADNASCGVFVLGETRTAPRTLDLAKVRLDMFRNGLAAGSGLGSAVQGHPAEAVAWLANTLSGFGIPFLKGEIILSGSLTPLVPAVAGDRFNLTIDGLGSAAIAFSE